MSIIRKHNITLCSHDASGIILRPLCDEHLPFLYKWNADQEILYYTEGGDYPPAAYSRETVAQIYGGVSQENLCFAVEIHGKMIGECWLQKMNLKNVKDMYSADLDVRRIDMMIGEKELWGKGIGTRFIKMLVEYAFLCEKVDVLHCLNEDYNIRSIRVFEKNGFTRILSEPLPQPQIGKFQYHWRLTQEDFIHNRMNAKRELYCSDGVVSLCEYVPQQDNETEYADWFDPKVIDAYNYVRTETFDTFHTRPSRSRFHAAIIRSTDGAHLGSLTLSPDGYEPDLAIIIHNQYRSQGYGTCAFKLGTKFCMDKFPFSCLHAGCYEGNIASSNMLKKCGFIPYPQGNVMETHYKTGESRMQYDFIFVR